MDKIKELYKLYLSKGLITNTVSFEDFSSANDEQKNQLYSLGKNNSLFESTDLTTFTSAWEANDTPIEEPKKVLDPAGAETKVGSIEDTVSKLENGFSEYRKKSTKSGLNYPEQAQDIVTESTSSDKYLKDLEASKKFYESEEGKAYTKRKSDYRESVKIKLQNNGAYKVGIEGSSYNDLIQNGLYSKLVDPVNELHFGLHGNNRPSLEIRDQIIQEEVLKAQQQEEQSLKDLELQETEKYIANGDYKPMFEVFTKQATSTFTPEEKNLSDLNKNLSAVNDKIKKTVDIEEKRLLNNKRSDLISQIKSSPIMEDRTFLFDPTTGNPVGTFEADEKQGEVSNKTDDYKKLKEEYFKSGKEKLERKVFTHGLEKARLNKAKNTTIDITTENEYLNIQEGSVLGERLKELGYKIEATDWKNENANIGVFKNVKLSDLVRLRKNKSIVNSIQKSITPKDTDKAYIIPDMQSELDGIADNSIRLALEEAALKETYYLNLDPSSDDAGIIDGTGSFLKESAKSIGKIVGLDKTIGEMLPSTRMEELDEINDLFTSGDIPISEENKEAFNRGFGMQFAEGMGGFTGDLIQFALLNKVAGAAGITARIAQITNKNKLHGTALKLLQEEFNFQVVTRGEAPTGEGIFFGLGSMGATKLIPKIKNSKFARFNSPVEKLVAPGVGMAAGSEAAAFAHAVVDDFANNKDIKTAIKEQYGDLDETGMRVILNIAMGSALGGRSIKVKKDFSSIATRRELLKNTQKEIETLKPNSKEFNKKLALISELQRDISFADEAFNKLDIGSQKAQRDEALKIIQSKATASEKAAAQETVDLYETNRVLAENKIRKSFEKFMRAGVTDKAKLVITDDPTLLEAGNKGQFEKSTNTITININKYKPGVFEQEVGHLFMKAAFKNNVEVAKTFKDKISEILNEKLKGESFSVGESKDLSFEDAIKEAYKNKPNTVPEEYIMNAVEFLSNPKFKDLLTKKGLLNELKQETLNVANKIGFDYTNKNNFKNGSDLLEFLFSINKTIEGGSSKAIQKKFEAFKNIVIDGKKLLDLETGREVVDPSKIEDIVASAEIDPANKKDIFSKAEKVYEEYKEDISSAGLMVGLEFEPIVKKMLQKYKDVYGMDDAKMDIIAGDVMVETRPGYNGIPALVRTWDPSKGASLTSHIYGNLPKRILGIIQNKHQDLGRTVSLVAEKAEKLTTEEGFGGGGGFVDSSSPELYPRVTRKKAEIKMGMSPEYSKRAEEVGERILMSTPLKDLDARIVGTIKANDGKTLRVAMLESNKARVYLPDGTVEVIPARTPKVVEQKYGAPEKSFKKIPTTKSLMIEDAKAYLIPEMEKQAGGLVDNYEPTMKYREFIDKTFSLYKDYLSQSAINKRFADFKEPVIDPVTGKQAREKTAQGKNIFTKKPLVLAEWRKYFIGDGTKRIDGRRRSLLEALATEQGFDKVMEVLSKESKRNQIESRQEDLNADLVENYVAILAKSLDRGNPDIMASFDFTPEQERVIRKDMARVLSTTGFDPEIYKKLNTETQDIIYNKLNEKHVASIIEATEVETSQRNKNTIDALVKLDKSSKDVWEGIGTVQRMSEPKLNSWKKNTKEVIANLPEEWSKFSYGGGKSTGTTNGLLSRIFSYNNTRSKSIFLKDKSGNVLKRTVSTKKGGDYEVPAGLIFNRQAFIKDFANYDKSKEQVEGNIKSNFENLKNSKFEYERKYYKKVKDFNKKTEKLINLDTYYTKVVSIIDANRKVENAKDGIVLEKLKEAFKADPSLKSNFLKESDLRSEFFNLMLDSIHITGKQIERKNGDINEFIKTTVGSFFVNNDFRGFRDFSKKEVFDISSYKGDRRDQHLKAKAIVAAELISAFKTGEIGDAVARKKILDKYESLIGSGEKQKIADKGIGYVYADGKWVKIGAEQLVLTKAGSIYKRGKEKSFAELNIDYLDNFYDIRTGRTLKEAFLAEKTKEIISDFKVNELLKTDPATKKHNAEILNSKGDMSVYASKEIELANSLAEMIERKKGISSKIPLSAAAASNIGKSKGKFDFYLPPNAEDFAGLMYKVYGKGKQGDADMAFIKKHLLDPYNAGEQAISTYKQNLAQDYKSIEKQLGEIEGSVSKETKQELQKLNFNSDQAVRVALWNQAGFEIPGIKNIEAAKLRRIVLKDKRLKAYADGIKAIVKGNLFEPSEHWFSSNIRYDLFTHATEGVRPIFLEQWSENTKAMFTPDNMNRLEAAYGKDYVKNLQGMLDRMKSGKSRGANVGKEVNAALDYLNGSVGVIMWMNTRSAMLQTISAVNYINWGDNNPINIAKTLAKPKEFAKTFKEIMNSDFLKQRRSGLEINIEEAEIAKAVEKSKGKANALFNYLIKAGFKPTQIADSFAIAVGGTPFLINRTKTYLKESTTAPVEELLTYNASPKSFNELGKRSGLVYLATNKREAGAYANMNNGKVRDIYIDKSKIATEKNLIDTMNDLGINTSEGLLYELIDPRFEDYYIGKENMTKVTKALTEKGFKAARYEDGAQVVSDKVESIVVFDKSAISDKKGGVKSGGMSIAEAKEKAFNDLREVSEENQQSSRQDRVSNIQTGILGRLVFAFNNTPMQMTRLQKKSALDLINRRGDWKTNVSKLAYYSTIQSVIFYALQQGAALTLFGKDDEDLTPQQKENLEKYKEKKTVSLANSVVDGFLSGSGMPGKILVTGKNTLNKYLEEEAKGYRADYGNVINEALSISPPLSSKTKKAYSAFKTYKYGSSKKGKAKMEEYNKFSPLHPYNVARAKIFSAATNIPVDRLLKKIENLNEAAFNESIEPQVKLALALGWDKWSLGFYDGLHDSEDSKESKSSTKKESVSSRKKSARQRAVNFESMPFKYRDSVRLARYKKRYKK